MTVSIIVGDCRDVLRTLPAGSAQTCVTSPPYFGLRDYGVAGQIGLEPTPDEFIAAMVAVFREVRRVLADDGTLWLNLGDSYASRPNGNVGKSKLDGTYANHTEFRRVHAMRSAALPPGAKHKDLLMIPVRVALALQADGWWLRSHIIWHKPNPMPESVTDRPTSAHESIFLLTKAQRYFYDAEAVKEPVTGGAHARKPGPSSAQHIDRVPRGRKIAAAGSGIKANASFNAATGDVVSTRNLRNVWTVGSEPFEGAHFATFPPALVEPCIKAGSREGDLVLDPFGGAGTTGLVADRLRRRAALIELNPVYAEMARQRICAEQPMFADVHLDVVAQAAGGV